MTQRVAPQHWPLQPRDNDGPVFREAWEAQVFAMALALHDRGVFTWTEWASALAKEINAAQVAGDPDLGTTYYRHWLNALERLVVAKGVTAGDALKATALAWTAAAHATPHGQPISLDSPAIAAPKH